MNRNGIQTYLLSLECYVRFLKSSINFVPGTLDGVERTLQMFLGQKSSYSNFSTRRKSEKVAKTETPLILNVSTSKE